MALNKVILMGRITHDLEVRQTQSGTAVLQFTVAVDRNYSKDGGEKQTDFISCVAWRNTAEFISRYFGRGRMIAVDGHLQSRTYEDKNGTKHYITELIVENANFTGEKSDGGNYQNNGFNQNGGGFVNQYQQAQQIQQTPQQTNGGFNGDAQTVGDLSEFEDVLTDDGSVPF